MKSKICVWAMGIFLVLGTAGFADADIWRVNNTEGIYNYTGGAYVCAGTPGKIFKTVNDAVGDDDVQANDILYIAGSATSYGDAELTKPLKIYGPGYFLSKNEKTQAEKLPATFSTFKISTGSESSEVYGLTMYKVELRSSNVSVERCNITNVFQVGGAVGTFTGQVIKNNYIKYLDIVCHTKNLIVTNNRMVVINCFENFMTSDAGESSSAISNNVITGSLVRICNSNFFNNILAGPANDETVLKTYNNSDMHNEISHNIFNGIPDGLDGTNSPDAEGNYYNQNFTTAEAGGKQPVFTIAPEVKPDLADENTWHSERQYELHTSSVAKNAGLGSVDCGMFGGATPYVLSGIPAIPAIYSYKSTGVATQGSTISVTVKAKTNN